MSAPASGGTCVTGGGRPGCGHSSLSAGPCMRAVRVWRHVCAASAAAIAASPGCPAGGWAPTYVRPASWALRTHLTGMRLACGAPSHHAITGTPRHDLHVPVTANADSAALPMVGHRTPPHHVQTPSVDALRHGPRVVGRERDAAPAAAPGCLAGCNSPRASGAGTAVRWLGGEPHRDLMHATASQKATAWSPPAGMMPSVDSSGWPHTPILTVCLPYWPTHPLTSSSQGHTWHATTQVTWGTSIFDQNILPPEAQSNVAAVECGTGHTLALLTDGRVVRGTAPDL